MSRVRRDAEYIGDAILNKIEAGDELCVSLDSGRYFNIEVSYVDEHGLGDKEVFCGDPEQKHLGLVVETESFEKENGYGNRLEWDVYAYTVTEDPDSPTDEFGIEALCVIGDNVQGPDLTIEEVEERVEEEDLDLDVNTGELQDLVDDLHTMKDEIDYVIRQARKVRDNEITLAEYENRLSAYEVRSGGQLTLDEL